MYKYFKLTNILYWVLGLGGMIAIAIAFFLLRTAACIRTMNWGAAGEFAIFAAALIIWVYGSDYLIEVMALRKMQRITNILNNECDPERFLAEIDKLQKIKNKEVYTTYMTLNKVCALENMDRAQEAKGILSSITSFATSRLGRLNQAMHLYLTAWVQIDLEDITGAENAIMQLKTFTGSKKLPQKAGETVRMEYEKLAAALEILKGSFEGAEGNCKSLFERATTELSRLDAKYYLGKTYLYYGKTNKAREAFQYVIDHGNKLHMVTKAKKELEKL